MDATSPVCTLAEERPETGGLMPLERALAHKGYAIARGAPFPPDFADFWNDLPLDTFMADGGRYRRRRYATFALEGGEIAPRPAEPHYQSLSYNPLNGGIARHFAPFAPEATTHPCLLGLLRDAEALFARSAPGARWHVEAHQFRILAGSENAGLPTPEGLHRDGVDRVLVQLVARHNVIGGVTRITDPAGRTLDRTTLTVPGDLYLLDDRRVMHEVSPVRPEDPARPGWRDVLVVTFRRRD